jgi:hypothetical protein
MSVYTIIDKDNNGIADIFEPGGAYYNSGGALPVGKPSNNGPQRVGTGKKLEMLAQEPRFWIAAAIAYYLYTKKPIYAVYFALAIFAYFVLAFSSFK